MTTSNKVPQRPQFANAPSFRATARGYYNAIPNFPAKSGNANLLLVNNGLPDNARNANIWIFCTSITTGWVVNGTYGQSASARTFYPNNLSQNQITFSGVVANQYEYDRIVEFTVAHHQQALNTFDQDSDPNNPGKDTAPLTLTLYPYIIDTGKVTGKGETVYREVYGGLPGAGSPGTGGTMVDGYIVSCAAGHDRFVNAKTFNLSFQVSYDYLTKPVHLTGEMNKQLVTGYMQSFGTHYKPVPPAAGSGFESTGGLPSTTPTSADPSTSQAIDFFTNKMSQIQSS